LRDIPRRERAENVKKHDVFTRYGPRPVPCSTRCSPNTPTRGCSNLDDANVLRIAPFSTMGSVVQLINAFGGEDGFEKAVHEM
jgi:type I restriction enzyme R subunit